MSIVNKRKRTALCIALVLIGMIFTSFFMHKTEKFQEYRKVRVIKLKKLLLIYNSLEGKEKPEKEELFFELARDMNALLEHPLAIDNSKESYRLQEKGTGKQAVIIENKNVRSNVKYGAFIDGRIDVIQE